jgi:uncharacterized phage-like protein YoqJ
MTTIALTGHRTFVPTQQAAQDFQRLCAHHHVTQVISGMAIGFDQWGARMALRLGIPVTTAIPCIGQERLWPTHVQDEYHRLLEAVLALGGDEVLVTPQPFSARAMQVRNEWMVDRCDLVVAWYQGTPGGTRNCIQYAKGRGKPIVNLKQGVCP